MRNLGKRAIYASVRGKKEKDYVAGLKKKIKKK